jgi:transposase
MKRKRFSKAFKVEAVRLLEQRSQTGAALARELGVRRNQLYKWRRELELHGECGAFNGPGRNAALDELSDIQLLKRRVQ